MLRFTRLLVPLLVVSQACAALRPASAPIAAAPLIGDRPDFTESPNTVARGDVQLESGQTVSREADTRITSVGEVLLRGGLSSRAELRLTLNSWISERSASSSVRGRDDGSIGAKVSLSAPEHTSLIRPSLSLIAATTLPTGSSALRARRAQPSAKLIASWTLHERAAFTSNFNYMRADGAARSYDEWAASGSLGVTLTERLGSFGEYFTVQSREGAVSTQHFVNAGVTWLVTPLFQLDARVGTGPSRARGDYFAGVGIVRRW